MPIKVNSLFDISVFNGLWTLLVGHKFELNNTRLNKLLELVHASSRMINMSRGILNQIPFVRYFAPKRSGYKDIKHISNEFYTFLKVNTTNAIKIKNLNDDLQIIFCRNQCMKTETRYMTQTISLIRF